MLNRPHGQASFMNDTVWASLVSAVAVVSGVLLGSWATSRRERQQRQEARQQDVRAAERALYTPLFIVMSDVQSAANSLARRRVRDDQAGVQRAVDKYMSHRDDLRRHVAETQLLAPQDLIPHAEAMLKAAEELLAGAIFGTPIDECIAAQREFNEAAEAFRTGARNRIEQEF